MILGGVATHAAEWKVSADLRERYQSFNNFDFVGTGNVFAGAPGYTQTNVGTEIDLKRVYKVGSIKGLKLVGLYGIFDPGAAVSKRNGGVANNANFAYLIAQYVF